MLASRHLRKRQLRTTGAGASIVEWLYEPVIYRQEVLTIMGLIGDLTFAVVRLVRMIEGDDGQEEADED